MRPDEDAGHDVAQHHRLLQALKQHRHNTGGNHDHGQVLQKLTSCMAYPAAIMPKPSAWPRMFNRSGTFHSPQHTKERASESARQRRLSSKCLQPAPSPGFKKRVEVFVTHLVKHRRLRPLALGVSNVFIIGGKFEGVLVEFDPFLYYYLSPLEQFIPFYLPCSLYPSLLLVITAERVIRF